MALHGICYHLYNEDIYISITVDKNKPVRVEYFDEDLTPSYPDP